MSFGGRLAQIRATEASDPARRAWSSAEEFDLGHEVLSFARCPCRPRAINAVLLSARVFRAGSRRASFARASLLHLTEVWIKCNSEQGLGAVSIQ
jgi:hypothetical protein